MLIGCCCHSTFEDKSAQLSLPPHIPTVHHVARSSTPGHLLISNIASPCPLLNNIAPRCPLLTKRGLSVCARPSRKQSWKPSIAQRHCLILSTAQRKRIIRVRTVFSETILESIHTNAPLALATTIQCRRHALPRSMDGFDPNQSRMLSNVIAFDEVPKT